MLNNILKLKKLKFTSNHGHSILSTIPGYLPPKKHESFNSASNSSKEALKFELANTSLSVSNLPKQVLSFEKFFSNCFTRFFLSREVDWYVNFQVFIKQSQAF